CLSIYPMKIWEEIERKLDRLPTFNASARKLQRALTGHATEVEMDANGRLMVPAPLREFAGITRKAVLMGQTRKFELWDAEQFEIKRAGWMDDIKDIAALDLPDEFAGLSL
ncbi:MAG: cell division/cell wall cluster transcriptional repressor MraZ, partial [Gammaproteobacteria bacterium]|nr:cell division/cell wall cluster transcriptional repressor MraZ [Gammaproteobacteria bacterium]